MVADLDGFTRLTAAGNRRIIVLVAVFCGNGAIGVELDVDIIGVSIPVNLIAVLYLLTYPCSLHRQIGGAFTEDTRPPVLAAFTRG